MGRVGGAASHSEDKEPAAAFANFREDTRRMLDRIGVQRIHDGFDFVQIFPNEDQIGWLTYVVRASNACNA